MDVVTVVEIAGTGFLIGFLASCLCYYQRWFRRNPPPALTDISKNTEPKKVKKKKIEVRRLTDLEVQHSDKSDSDTPSSANETTNLKPKTFDMSNSASNSNVDVHSASSRRNSPEFSRGRPSITMAPSSLRKQSITRNNAPSLSIAVSPSMSISIDSESSPGYKISPSVVSQVSPSVGSPDSPFSSSPMGENKPGVSPNLLPRRGSKLLEITDSLQRFKKVSGKTDSGSIKKGTSRPELSESNPSIKREISGDSSLRRDTSKNSGLFTAEQTTNFEMTGLFSTTASGMYNTNITLHDNEAGMAMSLPGYLSIPNSHYRLGEKLGQGGCGEIFHVDAFKPLGLEMKELLQDNKLVAKQMTSLGMDEFVQEVSTMALFMEVRHFAQLVAYDEQAMIIFMVYYPLGSLQSWLSHNEVNVKLAFYIIHGSFAAIYHLHKLGLVHNDIKSGNILLLEENGLVIPKLTDFGVSNVVEMKVIKVQAFKVRNARGISVAYAAPERLDIKLINNAIHARKAIEVAKNADLYSMAIVISEILLHGFPWSYI